MPDPAVTPQTEAVLEEIRRLQDLAMHGEFEFDGTDPHKACADIMVGLDKLRDLIGVAIVAELRSAQAAIEGIERKARATLDEMQR